MKRTLHKGEVRFEVRKTAVGPRKSVYEIYDKVNASFPYQTDELGKVKQALPSEESAQAECDRLNKEFLT